MRLLIALCIALPLVVGAARAAEPDAAPPQMTGWIEKTTAAVETEIVGDVKMVPAIPGAVVREWRSLDREGSASWMLVDLGWVAVATLVALFAEMGVARGLSRRPRQRIAARGDARLMDVLTLLACDAVGLAIFILVFGLAREHFLPVVGVSVGLAIFAANVLVRWRVVALIARVILRPNVPAARLVDLPDDEARHQALFLSGMVFAVITLVGFARYGLMDEDSGASHVIGLLVGVLVCAIYSLIIVHARHAGEALIRGRRSTGMVGAMRASIARAWVPLGLVLVAGLFVTFVAGLSLGLLGYYRAVSSTLGILFLLIVLDRLTEWDCRDDAVRSGAESENRVLVGRLGARLLRSIAVLVAVFLLADIWADAVEMGAAAQQMIMRSVSTAAASLFVAYILWEVVRFAIDRHLQTGGPGIGLPSADDDEETAPASRLQTILPLLRAAFAVSIAILGVLIALSQLGVNTAPLIAGAGVFGLAVSFGSQSLVRDVISGLFYMWDDAFRVGEYVDTGRLKGTVEKLGVRSVRLRHQNGPLHTIPYGQLGAVTNLSRDFATIKFNLRFDPRTDIELVRKTTKQIGIAMQDENEEMATEVMLPLKLQGIAEVVDNALVLRFKFTARPVKPSWVQREYMKRMYQVFTEKGITFASGAMFLQTLPSGEPAPASPEPGKPGESTAAPVAAALAAGVVAAAITEAAAEG
jgi:small-conductance mechanosensitive channel